MQDDKNGAVFGHNAPPDPAPVTGARTPRPPRFVGVAESRLRANNSRSWWSGPASLFAWMRGSRPTIAPVTAPKTPPPAATE